MKRKKTKKLATRIAIPFVTLMLLSGCKECEPCNESTMQRDIPARLATTLSDARVASSSENPNCFYAAGERIPEARVFPTGEETVGAVLIGFSPATLSPLAYYPTTKFQNTLSAVESREALIREVDNSDLANDYVETGFDQSPFDFYVSGNSVTAFKLLPQSWKFADGGFNIENVPSNKSSPFSSEVNSDQKIVLVDFDWNGSTPPGDRQTGTRRKNGCHYKYNLPVNIFSKDSGEEEFVTKIIIDPIIGNNGGPPGGP